MIDVGSESLATLGIDSAFSACCPFIRRRDKEGRRVVSIRGRIDRNKDLGVLLDPK